MNKMSTMLWVLRKRGKTITYFGCLLVVLFFVGVATWIGSFVWTGIKETKRIHAKLVELQALPQEKREHLATVCRELLVSGREGFVDPAEWPAIITELSPLDVRVSTDDIMIYFAGGHFPFLAVFWKKEWDGSRTKRNKKHQLEIVTELKDGDRVLWP